MDPQPRRLTERFALIFALVHTFLWIGFGIGLVFFVPSFQQIFREYRIQLPELTVMVLHWSRWLISFWFVLIPVLPVLFALDWGIMVFFRRNPATKTLGLLWALFVLAIPLLMVFITVVGIMLPLVKNQSLSK